MMQYIQVGRHICSFCHPDHDAKKYKLAPHLIRETGMWVGGHTKAKYEEFRLICQAYEAPLLAPCVEWDGEHGIYMCAAHLREVTAKLETFACEATN